jgi:predicted phosphohydrolase
MKRLAWLTDIHLNFLSPDGVAAFVDQLARVECEGILVGGDIGEADDVVEYLEAMAMVVERPIYFVLGNHDYYRGSIAAVRRSIEELCSRQTNLHWLPKAGVVRAGDQTALVGHDGWGDGRLGDYWGSEVELNDWWLIEELAGLDRAPRLAQLQALGSEAAAHLRSVLPEALVVARSVIVLTHVPPFREACWYEGRISNDQWLPHFSCQAVGDVLAGAMRNAPDHYMTVLCGHTHGAGEARILPNLSVLTGGADYGRPALQRVLSVD